MTASLLKILADFDTQLTAPVAVGDTTATLYSAADDDGVSLPAGTYGFTIDNSSSSKEYIIATLSGTALTGISNISRQGTVTSGFARAHRRGAKVTITDWAILKRISNLLDGTTGFDSAVKLGYDADPGLISSDLTKFASIKFVVDTYTAGGVNASTTVKGISEEATQAEVDARTTAGGTGADLFINPSTLRATKFSDPLASTGSANAYVLTVVPAITAYATGQMFTFIANFANTGSATLNVSGLGAKTIKLLNGATNLISGDIASGMAVTVVYDGTNMQMLTPSALTPTTITTPPMLDIQTFSASGSQTWTKPSLAKFVEVFLFGAGGSGGSGARIAGAPATASGGGGGGGGAFAYKRFNASALASTENVTVGAGGVGGVAVTGSDQNGNAGNAGAATTFGTTVYLRAPGGSAGAAGTNSGSTGGAGGASANGEIKEDGGAGGGNATAGTDSATANSPRGGGGGGHGSAGTGAAGGSFTTNYVQAGGAANTAGAAIAATFLHGGVGGGGGNASTTGGAGGTPGGGGGGGVSASTSGAGGVGAIGLAVIITHF